MTEIPQRNDGAHHTRARARPPGTDAEPVTRIRVPHDRVRPFRFMVPNRRWRRILGIAGLPATVTSGLVNPGPPSAPSNAELHPIRYEQPAQAGTGTFDDLGATVARMMSDPALQEDVRRALADQSEAEAMNETSPASGLPPRFDANRLVAAATDVVEPLSSAMTHLLDDGEKAKRQMKPPVPPAAR